VRTAGEIKTSLIFLRFDKSKRLPLSQIAKDSRCSPPQIMQAMRLEATETVLRRLDAYLDAKNLHETTRESRLMRVIEDFSEELFREFDARSIPQKDVALLSIDRQKRLRIAMEWRLKRLLREDFARQTQREINFADGLTYWRCKAKAISKGWEPRAHGNFGRRDGPSPVGKGR
jgi:hypothetical protein